MAGSLYGVPITWSYLVFWRCTRWTPTFGNCHRSNPRKEGYKLASLHAWPEATEEPAQEKGDKQASGIWLTGS